jgi:hypothetical protein
MRPAERAHRPRQQSALSAGGWIMLACIAVAFTEAASLPGSWAFDPGHRDVFRPEWLVLATLAVLFVHRAARACWWCALPAVVLPTLQLTYAVETGVERLTVAGAGDGARVWWVLLAVQVAIFSGAALSGASGSIRDRRWEKFVLRRLGPEPGQVTQTFHWAT